MHDQPVHLPTMHPSEHMSAREARPHGITSTLRAIAEDMCQLKIIALEASASCDRQNMIQIAISRVTQGQRAERAAAALLLKELASEGLPAAS